MDAKLVELVDASKNSILGDAAHIWQVYAEDAKKRHRNSTFILTGTGDYLSGCIYLCTLGEARKSVNAMRRELRGGTSHA